jgi:hypothetical protein
MVTSPTVFGPENDCAGERNCKRQIRPLVRENAPRQQTRNCLVVSPRWVLYSKKDWPTQRRS